MKSWAILLTFFFSQSTFATLIGVVTDEKGAAKAKEVVRLFQTTAPFSKMSKLSFRIITTTSKKLGCDISSRPQPKPITPADSNFLAWIESSHVRGLSTGINERPSSCRTGRPDRLITCETPTSLAYLGGVQAQLKAAFVMVVKSDSRYGGSGGHFPVITSVSPASMAIHELMHQLGFADEYEYYDQCEADMYCIDESDNSVSPSGYGNLPGTSFNVARFNSSGRYRSNDEVRLRHGPQIPWLSGVNPETPLADGGLLGTPFPGVTGLYKGITCKKASRRIDTWFYSGIPTIMGSLQTTYIPFVAWPILERSLKTKIDR